MRPIRILLLLSSLLLLTPCTAADRVLHLFVALVDNASQRIAPVPAKIGNGDDPANNLYWGCDDGVKTVFSKSKAWKRLAVTDPDGAEGPIMERLVFYNKDAKAWLIADAYRGKEIKQCLIDCLAAMAGTFKAEATAGDTKIAAGGAADLVAYIGHNALMEFTLETPAPAPDLKPKTIMSICCISRTYFAKHIRALKAKPLLLTSQYMYPAAQPIRDALAGWLAGKDPEACRKLAGAAYAANQKISVKSATGVYSTTLPEEE